MHMPHTENLQNDPADRMSAGPAESGAGEPAQQDIQANKGVDLWHGTGADTGAGANTGAGVDTGAGSGTGSGMGSGTDYRVGTSDAASDPGHAADPVPDTDTDTEPVTDPEPDTDPVPEPDRWSSRDSVEPEVPQSQDAWPNRTSEQQGRSGSNDWPLQIDRSEKEHPPNRQQGHDQDREQDQVGPGDTKPDSDPHPHPHPDSDPDPDPCYGQGPGPGQGSDDQWLREIETSGSMNYDPAPGLTTPAHLDASNMLGPEFGPVHEGRGGWLIKESTRAFYETQARRIWRAAARDLAAEAGAVITPMHVVDHLVKRGRGEAGVDSLKLSSWTAYRAALLWDFSQHPNLAEYALAVRVLEECRHPRPELAEEMRARDHKDRVEKRGIPRGDLRKLIDQLGAMGRTVHWGARTQHWVLAGIATGIRPGEWEHTRWVDKDVMTWLFAPNSKEKADIPSTIRQRVAISAVMEGRSLDSVHKPLKENLSMRVVPVDAIDRMVINAHLSSIAAAAEKGLSFTDYYNYCRTTLWRACKVIWNGKLNYSLYNARHQYSADVKRKLTPEEIAERMGHNNPRAARRHYASASEAHKGAGVMKQTDGQRGGQKAVQASQDSHHAAIYFSQP